MAFSLWNLGSIYDATYDKWFSPQKIRQSIEQKISGLSKKGVQSGDKVLILHGNNYDFYIDVLSLWEIGVCAIPMDPTSSNNEINNIASFVDAKIAITHEHIPFNINLESITSSDLYDEGKTFRAREFYSLDDDALILFTSGSTSEPKGVVHSFRTLMAKFKLFEAPMPPQDWKNTLCILPTHFVYGLISNSFYPLLHGANLYVYPSFNLDLLSRLGEIIDEKKITAFCSVPAMWEILLNMSPSPAEGSLKRVHCAASPLSKDLWRRAKKWLGGIEFKNVYGCTEIACAITGPADGDDFDDGLIGQGWGTQMIIMGEEGIKEQGDIGEIWLQGPSLMKGYFKRPEINKTVYSRGWFKTGDLGYRKANGDIVYVGRQKYVINKAGMKIYPEDIDMVLMENENIEDACAFAIDDPVAGESVAVALVPYEGISLKLNEIEKWCRQSMATFKVPNKWYVVDKIPRNSRGKVNRNAVKESCHKET